MQQLTTQLRMREELHKGQRWHFRNTKLLNSLPS